MRPIFTTGYEVEQGFLSSKTCDAIVSEASKLDAESLDCPVDVLASKFEYGALNNVFPQLMNFLATNFLDLMKIVRPKIFFLHIQ